VRSCTSTKFRSPTSICWVIRSDRLLGFVSNDSPFPQPAQEPYIDSPVPEAIRVAERLRAGAEERAIDFTPVHSFLLTLMEFWSLLLRSGNE
jgi:hypothetical protein